MPMASSSFQRRTTATSKLQTQVQSTTVGLLGTSSLRRRQHNDSLVIAWATTIFLVLSIILWMNFGWSSQIKSNPENQVNDVLTVQVKLSKNEQESAHVVLTNNIKPAPSLDPPKATPPPSSKKAAKDTKAPPPADEFDPVCLSSACLEEAGRSLARAFVQKPVSTWCLPSLSPLESAHGARSFDNATGLWQGLLLVKVPKAASSTAAGATLRMAHRGNCTGAVQWHHAEGYHYEHRIPTKSFVLGSIRRPAARAFSNAWFFMLAPLNVTPTDRNVLRAVNTRKGGRTKGKGGYQYNYLSLTPVASESAWSPYYPTQVRHPEALRQRLHDLLVHDFDFVLVVERMDESLTALSLLTGLSLGDVLVPSNSKVAGGYLMPRVGRRKGQCHYQPKGTMSPGVQEYFDSPEWRAMNYADEVLYRAANASLDATIAGLGPERFAKALQEFQRLQARALEVCGADLGGGCTADGKPLVPQPVCYDRDFGCGYECVDRMLLLEPSSA